MLASGLNFTGFQALMRHEANVRYELSRATFQRMISKDLAFFSNEKIGALTSRYIDFLRSHVTIQDLLIIRTLTFFNFSRSWTNYRRQPIIINGSNLNSIINRNSSPGKIQHQTPQTISLCSKRINGESNGKVADALTNNLIVKTFAGEQAELQHIDEVNNNYRIAFIKDLSRMGAEGSARILTMSITQVVSIGICAT